MSEMDEGKAAHTGRGPFNGAKVFIVGLLYFVLGVATTLVLSESRHRTTHYLSNPALYPLSIFRSEIPPVPIPTLQVLTAGAETDEEILEEILVFFQDNHRNLSEKWGEKNPRRLQALFSMYVIHNSQPYGVAPVPASFREFIQKHKAAHCGIYGRFQSKILDAFQLEWRYVAVSTGEHGWIEAKIDGTWELFDSTVNLWIDRSALELQHGSVRSYREWYTPWSDPTQPKARASIAGGVEPIFSSPGLLRMKMIGLGLFYLTQEERTVRNVRLEIWTDFQPPAS